MLFSYWKNHKFMSYLESTRIVFWKFEKSNVWMDEWNAGQDIVNIFPENYFWNNSIHLICILIDSTNRSREGRDQYFATRPITRLLEILTYGRFRDPDIFILKSRTRPGWDRESCAFSPETETRTWRYLNKVSRFPIFVDDTRPETSWKIYKKTSPRLRLINN